MALWLAVIVGVSITSCTRASADADEPGESVEPAAALVEARSPDDEAQTAAVEVEYERPCWSSSECTSETFLPASYDGGRHHPGRRAPRGFFMTLLSALSVLLLVFVWRRPGGSVAKCEATVAPISPRDIVCLSCSRCGRVIDVRRDSLARQLFCPRCGTTMPRDV